MPERLSRAARSAVMRRIPGRGNRTTEVRLRSALTRAGVRGWRVQPVAIMGKPDFAFLDAKVAIFVDGCFWHGCRTCGLIPQSNPSYWVQKIGRNKERDGQVSAELKMAGWKVVRIWEHDLRNGCQRAVEQVRIATGTRDLDSMAGA
jgi:DNA mismatch endonuclease Vsr